METDLGQGHVECGKCSTSDASALSDIAAADGLRRKITARTWAADGAGWLDKAAGREGKRGCKKVCVMNYYPLIKVHVDFFRPFQPCCWSIFRILFQCCEEFSGISASS